MTQMTGSLTEGSSAKRAVVTVPAHLHSPILGVLVTLSIWIVNELDFSCV